MLDKRKVIKITKKEAIILGTMLGDGCLCISQTKRGTIYLTVISGHIKEDEAFLVNFIKPILFDIFKKWPRERRQPRYGKLDLVLQSKKILNLMNEKLGLPIGKSRDRKIKKEFIQDTLVMQKIIAGFFATDGSFVITNNNGTIYPRIEFQNISQTLLKQIQIFLSKTIRLKGGGLYKMHREKGIVYRLQYNGKENLLKFVQEIGFINPKNKKKFKGYYLRFMDTTPM